MKDAKNVWYIYISLLSFVDFPPPVILTLPTTCQAFLSGSSAGGLASILHCDSFRALIPCGAKVKCLSDAGYFINV